jgi:serine/threonine protein kinase
MSQRVEWEVLKSSGRWRGARAEALEPGARLDGDGLGDLFRARRDELLLRILPGTPAVWRKRAETLVKLGHPGLLGIVGIGHLDDRVVLVEDLPQHPDLHTFVRAAGAAGGLSLQEVGRVFTELLSALRHIHGANLTHGGLSAGGVSVGRDGVGVLEARVSGAGVLSGLREDGEAVPLELWDTLAPELVEASALATVASDLFAVGVLLMHALTGDLHPPGTRAPWRELSPDTEALRRAIRAAREDLPDALVELIAGLLAAQPEDRQPKSVQELLRRIQKERWEPREIPVRPSKPSRPLPSPALVAAPQERPLMIVTSRPVPRAADAPVRQTLAADDAGAEAVSRVAPPTSSLPEETVETKLPPAAQSEELADDTLPVGAPSFHDLPQAISPAPVKTAPVEVVPADAAPVEPSPVEASPVETVPSSTRASDEDELVSTLPLSASATRTVMPDDPEATLPIGASSSAFTTDPSREGEVTSQFSDPSSAGQAPRAIPPTQRLSLPEPTASLGTDLFAGEPPPMVYDDADVATSVKVHHAAPQPALIQPQVATTVSAPAVGRRSGYDPPTPTVAVPGLASHERSMVPPSDETHPVADSEGLPLATKIAILLTGAIVSIAVFLVLIR